MPRLLLIDDDPGIFGTLLEGWCRKRDDYEFRRHEFPRELDDPKNLDRYDILIVDQDFGSESETGIDFLNGKVRTQRRKDQVVLMVSRHMSPTLSDKAIQVGADGVINRDIGERDLIHLLNRVHDALVRRTTSTRPNTHRRLEELRTPNRAFIQALHLPQGVAFCDTMVMVATPYPHEKDQELQRMLVGLKRAVSGLTCGPDDVSAMSQTLFEKLQDTISLCSGMIVVLARREGECTVYNPNVVLEAGLALASGVPVLFVMEAGVSPTIADLAGVQVVQWSKGSDAVLNAVQAWRTRCWKEAAAMRRIEL